MKKCMQSLQMPHTPWTSKVGKCAALAQGGGGQGKLELPDMHNVFTESPLLPCIPLHIWNSIHVKVLYGQFYN